jgi:O-antigen ligase
MLRSIWVAFAGVIAVACLLPFAIMPSGGASVSPSLLELSLLLALGLTLLLTVLDRNQTLVTGGRVALWLLLVGTTAFTFLLGLGRGYTTQTLHDYGKFVLALSAFWLTVQLVRTVADAATVLRLLLAGVGATSAVGLALYAAGPGVTERVLVRLIPYGYPGSRIVRYIEDDPARPMRVVGTGVDPNSFGGLCMLGFVLAVAQLAGRRRVVPVWLASVAAAVSGLAMLLTYSRGAWVGAFAGVVLVLILMRPRLLIPLGAVGVVGLALGAGQGFVERLWLGFTLQDPATKLRLDEYRNAWNIIQRHPWFGVGFGEAGSIDLQAGVSSIYLTIAEQAGLVGLGVFLVVVGAVLWRAARHPFVARRNSYEEREVYELTVAFAGALVAALTVGLVDHYFFNIRFAHMAALFWIVAGCVVALSSMRGLPVQAAGARRMLKARHFAGIGREEH